MSALTDLPRSRTTVELLSVTLAGKNGLVWKNEDGSYTHEWTAPFDPAHFQYSITFRQRKVRFWWLRNQLRRLNHLAKRKSEEKV